jgi:hypothetical protein
MVELPRRGRTFSGVLLRTPPRGYIQHTAFNDGMWTAGSAVLTRTARSTELNVLRAPGDWLSEGRSAIFEADYARGVVSAAVTASPRSTPSSR